MGKDQRGKKHGLDLRRNQKLRQEREQALAPQKPAKQHRGRKR